MCTIKCNTENYIVTAIIKIYLHHTESSGEDFENLVEL